MADYFFNSVEREIFLYDSLEVYKLNETGAFIFEQYINHIPVIDILQKLMSEYDVDKADVESDVNDLIASFKEFKLEPQNSNSNIHGDDEFDVMGQRFHLHTPIGKFSKTHGIAIWIPSQAQVSK